MTEEEEPEEAKNPAIADKKESEESISEDNQGEYNS